MLFSGPVLISLYWGDPIVILAGVHVEHVVGHGHRVLNPRGASLFLVEDKVVLRHERPAFDRERTLEPAAALVSPAQVKAERDLRKIPDDSVIHFDAAL